MYTLKGMSNVFEWSFVLAGQIIVNILFGCKFKNKNMGFDLLVLDLCMKRKTSDY